MLSLEDAREKILQAIQPVDAEHVSLHESFERVLTEPITAPVNLPPFDNSAMDGYAVRAADVANASVTSTVTLRVIGKVAAGETFNSEVETGTCVRLFTGSVLPKGADAVVMQEDTKAYDDGTIAVSDKVTAWENVRFRGEDVKLGAAVLQPGERLSATRISLLAALGFSSVPVSRKPIVGLLATGSELREPGQPLQGAAIYESNRAGVSPLVQRAGGIPKIYPLVRDDLEATAAALAKALEECDIVITSGGVSVGEFDYVKAAFEQLGGTLDFWKVAVRPGKPFVFGSLNGRYFCGLPGNPVSALVTFCLLVWPALLRMQNAKSTHPPIQFAKLAQTLVNRGERRHFMRVIVEENGEARSAGAQAAHVLSSAARANGLVDVPANGSLEKGALVPVLRWD
ncbi:MAG: Molybdopterin molybdenumtransferase MoeA [Verrucomicrobiales bacterium]|nr:Molybdopterin molybdenumtransferase MoeA [Verrucomicrobiales bacterium]